MTNPRQQLLKITSAIENKNYDEIKKILEDEKIINMPEAQNAFVNAIIAAAENNRWDIVTLISTKKPAHLTKSIKNIFNIAIKNNKPDELKKLYSDPNLDNAFDELLYLLVEETEPSRIAALLDWLDQKKNLSELLKRQVNYQSILARLSRQSNWYLSNVILDKLKSLSVIDHNDAYGTDVFLLNLTSSSSETYQGNWEGNPPIEEHLLVEKALKLNPRCAQITNGQGHNLLQIAIYRNKSINYLEVLCTKEELLEIPFNINKKNIFLYAAEVNKWNTLHWLAKKYPTRFTKAANRVFDHGIAQHKFTELSHFFDSGMITDTQVAQSLLGNIIRAAADRNEWKKVCQFATINPTYFATFATEIITNEMLKFQNFEGILELFSNETVFNALKSQPGFDSLYTRIVNFVADNNQWALVYQFAKSSPTLFSNAAKEILTKGIQQKRLDDLNKLFSDKDIFGAFSNTIDELIKSNELIKINSMFNWLHRAAEFNLTPICKKLSDEIHKKNRITHVLSEISPAHDNMTILEVACKYNSNDCISLITQQYKIDTQKYSDLNVVEKLARTRETSNWHLPQALSWLVKNRNYLGAKTILEYSESFLSDGSVEAIEALKNNDLQMFILLMEHKAKLRIEPSLISTIISFYFENQNPEQESNYLHVIKILLEHGASPNTSDGKESKFLIETVKRNKHQLAELLLQYKACTNTANIDDHLLFNATIRTDHKMKELLIRYNAPSYSPLIKPSTNTMTPLYPALDGESKSFVPRYFYSGSPFIANHPVWNPTPTHTAVASQSNINTNSDKETPRLTS